MAFGKFRKDFGTCSAKCVIYIRCHAVRSGPRKLWDYKAYIMKLSMILATAAIPLAVGFSSDAVAQRNYGPGVTDTEIKIGQTAPYSGPLSSLGIFGRVETAYLRKITESGGINGRTITLISLDHS